MYVKVVNLCIFNFQFGLDKNVDSFYLNNPLITKERLILYRITSLYVVHRKVNENIPNENLHMRFLSYFKRR